jgi:hypothetical protein
MWFKDDTEYTMASKITIVAAGKPVSRQLCEFRGRWS